MTKRARGFLTQRLPNVLPPIAPLTAGNCGVGQGCHSRNRVAAPINPPFNAVVELSRGTDQLPSEASGEVGYPPGTTRYASNTESTFRSLVTQFFSEVVSPTSTTKRFFTIGWSTRQRASMML